MRSKVERQSEGAQKAVRDIRRATRRQYSAEDKVRIVMNQAYATREPRCARRLLENLARPLEHQHPGAAASVREGLEETLTVMRLGLPENLERVLSSNQPH